MRIGGGAVSIADVTDRTARDLGFVRPFWLNEIRAGRAFTFVGRIGPTAANFSHVQLVNPAASGITVVVYAIKTGDNVNAEIEVRTHNAELTNDIGAGVNLLSGGAAAAAHIRTEDNVALQGTLIERFPLLAGTPHEIVSGWHMELGAGEGLLIVPDGSNQRCFGNFRWIEF